MLGKAKPARDKKFLEFVRQHDCLDCGWPSRLGGIEAHHIHTGGFGTKCSDYETVPLCGPNARGCHRKADKCKTNPRLPAYEKTARFLHMLWESLKCVAN